MPAFAHEAAHLQPEGEIFPSSVLPVRRCISQWSVAKAREAAEKMTDPRQAQDRGMLLSVANDARTDSERLMKGYDDLTYIARMFSGRDFGS